MGQFLNIKKLMKEWGWDEIVKYDVVFSSEDENPIITFYVPKDRLGYFVGSLYIMGECGDDDDILS